MNLNAYGKAAEEIKSRCNIVDVINSVVPLKRNGNNHKGCCPFHKEKTPSFVVSESKQFYHCFGCGVSGDVFSFVMNYYNLGFTDAVEKLAVQYGVDIEKSSGENVKKKDIYYDINKKAARFFYDALTKKANAGYSYMKGRSFEPAVMQKFGIGFADAEWSSLSDNLIAQGINKDLLIELGLSSKAKDGHLYDKYRSRVIFPIIDTKGKVIGFGGRIVGEGEPKYLNSQESIVFSKKNNLFGLNLTKSEIQKEGFAILVEGYMDVVALYQSGVKNVAASLGTALTEQQARLLKRYTDKVYLSYDSDGPGTKAAFIGIDVLRGAGVEVRVIQVDDGKDPDEFVKKHGREAFMDIIRDKSLTDVDYKVMVIRRRYDLKDTTQGIRFLENLAVELRKLSPVEQDIYIQKIAREYKISEGALRNEVHNQPKSVPVVFRENDEKPKSETIKSAPEFYTDPAALPLERNLIRLVLHNSSYFGKLSDYPEAFQSPPGSELRLVLSTLYKDGQDFDVGALRDELTEDCRSYIDEILTDIPIGEHDDAAFSDCLKALDSRRIKRRQKEIEDILSLDDGTVDKDKLNELMKEYTQLQKQQKR